MNVAGTTYLRASTKEGTHTYAQALVSNTLTHKILLSWLDLQELNIILIDVTTVQMDSYAKVQHVQEKENFLMESLIPNLIVNLSGHAL